MLLGGLKEIRHRKHSVQCYAHKESGIDVTFPYDIIVNMFYSLLCGFSIS